MPHSRKFSRAVARTSAAAALLCLAALPGRALAQAEITDPPPDHHFGKVVVGSPGVSQYFSVFNQGASPLLLGRVTVDGAMATCAEQRCPAVAPQDFTLPPGSDGCSETVLAPGAGCSALVVFTPGAPGGRAARLVVPVPGQTTLLRALGGAGTVQPLDCVLDWAEKQFPELLTHPTPTLRLEPFHARCYGDTELCVGADDAVATVDRASVYVFSPALTPALQNLGYVSDWAAQARCR